MNVIETDQLVKKYGRITALKQVNLTVTPGEIFGLLGQNGAGKTTLIKILLGVVSSTQGTAQLLGQPAGSAEARRRVGYLPEDHRFPDYHTGASLLDFYGSLLDMPARARRERIPPMLEMVGIGRRAHSKVRTYSKGMKQRLGIAQALLHDPEVIFLDEPTDGVDPVGRREIRDLLLRLKQQGKTIFLNSHLLSELEMVCDRVAILARGEVVEEGTVADLTRQHGLYEVGIPNEQSFPQAELSSLGYRVQRRGTPRDQSKEIAELQIWEVTLIDNQQIDPLIDCLRQHQLSLRLLLQKKQTLEDLFLATVERTNVVD